MWYVCDKEFWLAFSQGYATEAEASKELIRIKEFFLKEFNKEIEFITLFIEG